MTIVLVLAVLALLAGVALWYRPDLGGLGQRFWDFLVRMRTWLLGGPGLLAEFIGAALPLLPEFLRSPELMAVLTPEVRHWMALVSLVLALWSRPRPASRSSDPDVQVNKALKGITASTPAVVEVTPAEVVDGGARLVPDRTAATLVSVLPRKGRGR